MKFKRDFHTGCGQTESWDILLHKQDNHNLDHNLPMVVDYSWVIRGKLSISKPLVKGSVYVILTARGLRAKLIKLGKLA